MNEQSVLPRRGFTSLWATFLAFGFFVASLFILLTKTDPKWQAGIHPGFGLSGYLWFMVGLWLGKSWFIRELGVPPFQESSGCGSSKDDKHVCVCVCVPCS